MMKSKFLFLSSALLLLSVVLFNACSKDNDKMPVAKNIVYEAKMTNPDDNNRFYIIASYTDKNGNTVKVDQQLPFRVELKDVPVAVKAKMEGYLYSVAGKEIIGVISCSVTDAASGKNIYNNKKELNLIKDGNNTLGYTGEEMKEKTYFSFAE